jgi:hypothetical protein
VEQPVSWAKLCLPDTMNSIRYSLPKTCWPEEPMPSATAGLPAREGGRWKVEGRWNMMRDVKKNRSVITMEQ